jgi:chromosome partitioning protein
VQKKIISVIQQKGGVGKTTIAVHLAHEIKKQHPKLKVAIADADPQQSATRWIRRGQANDINSIEAFTVASDGEGKKLRHELAAIDAELILVDLPPAIESVSLRAALYADLMLVPVGASPLDLEAARGAIDVCEEALELDNSKKFLLVPSKVRTSTKAGKELRSVLSEWGPVSQATIGLRVHLSDAAISGEGIHTYAPQSPAHKEIQRLAREVFTLAKRKKK